MDSEHRGRHRAAGAESTHKPRRGPGRQTPGQTQQRNLELLDKALEQFVEKGFERATIDGIATAAGMAKRTVYLRYGDKTQLFKAALQRAIEAWIVPVDRLRAAETDDVDETLLRIGQILVTNIMSPAGLQLLRITNAESGQTPEIGQFTYKQGTAPTLAYLADVIRRKVRIAGRAVPDADEAAYAFLALVVGGPASMLAWGIPLDKHLIERRTRYAVHLFLHGTLSIATGGGSAKSAGKHSAPPSKNSSAADGDWKSALVDENRRLKVLLAESMLEIAALKDPTRSRRG